MNLRVDLILETEQRSASVLSLKSLIRIVMIVVPLALLALLAMQIVGLLALKNEQNALEARWLNTEPLEVKALALAQQCQTNTDLLHQLNGWRKSRLDWHAQILNLMRKVPGNIQMQNLRVGQSLQLIDDKTTARVFTMELKGKAYGLESEASVNSLQQILSKDTFFSNYIQKVEVPLFGADPTAGADKNDRVFEIRCSYRERKFE